MLQQHSQAAHAQHFSKNADPKIFVQTFLGGGGFNPRNPLWLRACTSDLCVRANQFIGWTRTLRRLLGLGLGLGLGQELRVMVRVQCVSASRSFVGPMRPLRYFVASENLQQVCVCNFGISYIHSNLTEWLGIKMLLITQDDPVKLSAVLASYFYVN